MPVLIEGLSVVVKRASIESKYPGGWEAFLCDIPNRTLCYDEYIARVGFMTPPDAQGFVQHLQAKGLCFTDEGIATDIAGVSQLSGLLAKYDWLEFDHMELDGPAARVAFCRLVGTEATNVVCPMDWQYEGSLSQQYVFVDREYVNEGLKFLRHQDGVDVYLNLLSGEEVFVGRTTKE
jgi:hypothetical protein